MNALSALTVAFRFKIAVAGTQLLVTKFNSSSTPDQTFAAYTYASTLKFIVGDGTTIVIAASTTTLSTGVWYSAVCQYDGVNAEVYIDGEATPSGTIAFSGTLANSASPFAIGTRSDGAAVFNGTVDDVIIADHAFTSVERAGYNALSENFGDAITLSGSVPPLSMAFVGQVVGTVSAVLSGSVPSVTGLFTGTTVPLQTTAFSISMLPSGLSMEARIVNVESGAIIRDWSTAGIAEYAVNGSKSVYVLLETGMSNTTQVGVFWRDTTQSFIGHELINQYQNDSSLSASQTSPLTTGTVIAGSTTTSINTDVITAANKYKGSFMRISASTTVELVGQTWKIASHDGAGAFVPTTGDEPTIAPTSGDTVEIF